MSEKSFVLVSQIPPPKGKTIFVRSGNAYFDAAQSRWSNKWWHLHNGRETEIAAPTWWYCPEDYLPQNDSAPHKEYVSLRRNNKRPQQTVFDFV